MSETIDTTNAGRPRGPVRDKDKHITLGARIRKCRHDTGTSRDLCAAKLGISGAQFGKLEVGQNRINAVDLQALADLMGVSFSDFFKDAKPKKRIPREIAKYLNLKSAKRKALIRKLINEFAKMERD